MAVEMSIQVAGLKDALKELNGINKKLRRDVTTNFQKIVKPVITEAKSRLPDEAPLSGMARSWTGNSGVELMHWDEKRVERNLKAFTSAKNVRDRGFGMVQNLAVFGIRWAGPQATAFEVLRNGSLGAQLTRRYGTPSRLIWRAYETRKNEVEQQVKDLAADVMRQVGRGGRI